RRGGPASDAHREASRIGARRQPSCRSGFASHRTGPRLWSATPCAIGDVGPIIRLSCVGRLLRDYFLCRIRSQGARRKSGVRGRVPGRGQGLGTHPIVYRARRLARDEGRAAGEIKLNRATKRRYAAFTASVLAVQRPLRVTTRRTRESTPPPLSGRG